VVAGALVWPGAREKLGRGRGVALIVVYALTMAMMAVFAR